MPELAEMFAQIYPQTRFLCLYRSCGEVIRAVLDASPWGIADAAFTPYTRTYPGSTVAALTAYWSARTASLLAFEQSHPQAVLRIRFEYLVGAEEQSARAVMSFLGTGTGGPEGDAGSPGAAAAFPARSQPDFPVGLIPSAVLTRVNDLHRQLGYAPLPDV